MSSQPFYRVDFAVNDADPLQRTLNELYGYEHDVATKVLHRARLNLFSLLMRDLIGRGVVTGRDRALDMGCAAGVYAKVISDLGFRSVLGIDIDAPAIELARRMFGSDKPGARIEFAVADAERLGAADRYDLVLCTEVIEHTRDPRRVVENIHAALGPGGVAVVTLPNAISLPYLAALVSRRRRGRPLEPELRDHLRFPFYRTLALFSGVGLERVATDGTNLVLDPRTLRALYGKTSFAAVNEANFRLSRLWPLKYLSQFFLVAVRKRGTREDAAASARAGGARGQLP